MSFVEDSLSASGLGSIGFIPAFQGISQRESRITKNRCKCYYSILPVNSPEAAAEQ